jgi:phosphopantothenoylcysteine synthetase/decarboxylase
VANVATLRDRGTEFIGPEEGLLACGYEGLGRMWPVEGILERVERILAN